MTQDELVKRAKDLAARKAFEAYGKELERLLGEAKLPLSVLGGTTHIHSAILLGGGEAVAIRCQWDFTTDPVVLARAVAMAKSEGVG